MKFLLLFLFLTSYAFSEEPCARVLPDVSAFEGLPCSLVNDRVCIISGEYRENSTDVVIAGPESLVMTRSYGSLSPVGSLCSSWSLNHGGFFLAGEAIYKNEKSVWVLAMRKPSCAQLDYTYPKSPYESKRREVPFEFLVPKGLANGGRLFSGQTNVKNQRVCFSAKKQKVELTTGTGDCQTFELMGHFKKDGWNHYGITKDKKINGSVYRYERKNKHLSKITCSSQGGCEYSCLRFPEQKRDTLFEMHTSDSRKASYHMLVHKFKKVLKKPGEESTYHNDFYYLSKVESSFAPQERYQYEPDAANELLLMSAKKLPKGRYLNTSYYRRGLNYVGGVVGSLTIQRKSDFRLNRVKSQLAPVGHDKKPITTHRFVYHCKVKEKDECKELLEGHTDVYDAYDHYTKYTYDEVHHLRSIKHYTGTSAPYTLHSKENFIFGDGADAGNLIGTLLKDGQKQVHHAKYYSYDSFGNVTSVALCGPLTGLPSGRITLHSNKFPASTDHEMELTCFHYSQDGRNLLLKEIESNGKETIYSYLPGTNHVEKKFIFFEGRIQLREFYYYDESYVLIRIIRDDGLSEHGDDWNAVTERFITTISPRQTAPFGLPERIEERYYDWISGEEKILSAQRLAYNREGHVTEKEVFDSNYQSVYTLRWEYDGYGNVLRETNALGESILRKYDENNNLIFQQGPSYDKYTEYTYDFSNRLIREEEVHPGERFVTAHTYNYLHQKTSTTDPYGHTTYYEYDDRGNITKVSLPAVAYQGQMYARVITSHYDIAGNPISVIDPQGRETRTTYTIRGKPTLIQHSDGSEEKFYYRLDGQLLHTIDPTGLHTYHEKDPMGRVKGEYQLNAQNELLSKVEHTYRGNRLISTFDAIGQSTQYTYDPAGRLLYITKGNRLTQYLYDSLNRVSETREWYDENQYYSTIKVYDLLDRVIEERVETADGTLCTLTRCAYDADGNKILEQIGDHATRTTYNLHQKPTTITDALGNVTHITYNRQHINSYAQRVLQVVTTDPLGQQTIETYDTAHRIVESKVVDSLGQCIAKEERFYDLIGNCCRILQEVMKAKNLTNKIETLFEYTLDQQVSQITEAAGTPEQKITRHLYQKGLKIMTLKPTGMHIVYAYDDLKRLKALHTLDYSLCYTYEYNARHQPTRIIDEKQRVTERLYNENGDMIQETLGNELVMQYTHDRAGRVHSCTLPDQTQIEYAYQGPQLKEVRRITPNGSYSHVNSEFNNIGMATEQILPGKQTVSYAYDSLHRKVTAITPAFRQSIPPEGFDGVGNIRLFYLQEQAHTFAYDEYYHLIQEDGHHHHIYSFDSLANRLTKNEETYQNNSLHQLTQKGEETFVYNHNGNLLQRIQNGGAINYGYDALDRLTSITSPDYNCTYTYDSFGRRIAKKEGEGEELYLYHEQDEIGSWKEGKIEQLRINNETQAIALELQNKVYIPFYDLFGNILAIQDLEGNLIERYRYSAFGEREILSPQDELLEQSSIGNPWQYAGKRFDEKSQLVAFGLRNYDPGLGRWLVQDPAGFVDGPNLYAYVHNSPLKFQDKYGLLGEAFSFGNLNLGVALARDQLERDKIPKPVELGTGLYSLNSLSLMNPETNSNYQFPSEPHIMNIYVNGVSNNTETFKSNLLYINKTINRETSGYFIPTKNFCSDSGRYLLGLEEKISRENTNLFHTFNDYLSLNPKNHIICISHSCGTVDVKNALLICKEEMRQRVSVIAVAPGEYIQKVLCKDVTHLVSKWDLVPWLDIFGRFKHSESIVTLKSHPEASYFDHSFQSPTYKSKLQIEYSQILRDIKTNRRCK